ncbi:hypothetical protein BDZ45DRAFT_741037 [Acephala macrosclerotiorum]|nr:hypothetical protein BDZ45DRAFT_741037 [Acephala macrosclerotiorum]
MSDTTNKIDQVTNAGFQTTKSALPPKDTMVTDGLSLDHEEDSSDSSSNEDCEGSRWSEDSPGSEDEDSEHEEDQSEHTGSEYTESEDEASEEDDTDNDSDDEGENETEGDADSNSDSDSDTESSFSDNSHSSLLDLADGARGRATSRMPSSSIFERSPSPVSEYKLKHPYTKCEDNHTHTDMVDDDAPDTGKDPCDSNLDVAIGGSDSATMSLGAAVEAVGICGG